MAKFYRIKLDSIYLTDTGLSGGTPCKLQITGASDLLSSVTGSTLTAVDGTPIQQTFATGTRGRVLELRVAALSQSVWTSIVALVNTALENSDTINIVGTGEIGNFDVDAVPQLPKPFEAQEFTTARIKNAVFRFITV